MGRRRSPALKFPTAPAEAGLHTQPTHTVLLALPSTLPAADFDFFLAEPGVANVQPSEKLGVGRNSQATVTRGPFTTDAQSSNVAFGRYKIPHSPFCAILFASRGGGGVLGVH